MQSMRRADVELKAQGVTSRRVVLLTQVDATRRPPRHPLLAYVLSLGRISLTYTSTHTLFVHHDASFETPRWHSLPEVYLNCNSFQFFVSSVYFELNIKNFLFWWYNMAYMYIYNFYKYSDILIYSIINHRRFYLFLILFFELRIFFN